MKKTLLKFKKTALIVFAVLASSSYAMAGSFIAIASGDFSSASVWLGGSAPSGNMNGIDNITINAGVVVNLDKDIQMNNLLASLIVNGTLQGDKSLDVKIGAVTGTGIIDIKDLNLEVGASFLFLGDATVDNFSNKSILSLKSNIVVEKFLYLMDGSLSILGKLTLADQGTLVFDKGDFDILGSLLDFGGVHNILYQGNRKKIGSEATRKGLRNLIIDLTDNNGTIDLLNDLEINGILDIKSGNLNTNGKDLIINGGLLTALTGTITSDDATNLTFNITSSSSLLLNQLGGSKLGNLILNSSNGSTLTLLSNIEIGGNLDLRKGNLSLNNKTLVLLGSLSNTAGLGYILGTSNSNLVLLKDGDIGNLAFDNQNNILGSLILGGKNALLFLGSDLNIVRDLDLTNGKINIMGYDLTLLDSGRILGYSKDNFIITDGDGSLIMVVKSLTERLFPVGSANRFAPATVKNNSSTAKYKVRSLDKILQDGITGVDISLNLSSVNNSWFVENLSTLDIDIDLTLAWDSTMERNGFDRTNGFISHFTNSVWDVVDQLDAVLDVNGLWSMTRKNLTSLSPFSVQGVQESTSGIDKNNAAKFSVYPNPASQFINVESAKVIEGNISIYDMLGREVMTTDQTKQIDISGLNSGVYFIKINGEQVSKFTKQ